MAQYGEVRVDYIAYTTGTVPNEANATVTVSSLVNDPTFSGDVQVGGNVTITGNLNVSGDSLFDGITVSGNSILNTLTVTGNSNLEDVEISGTLTVTGDTFVSGDLTVQGDLNASGVTISGFTGLFASGTEAAPSISFIDDTDTGFYSPDANEVAIATSGSTRLLVNTSGQVGIGTASPGTRLHVNNGALRITNSGVEGGQIEFSNNDGATIDSIIDVDGSNDFRIFTTAANRSVTIGQLIESGGNVRFFTGGVEQMRINASGYVGINTQTAAHRLDVSGIVNSSAGYLFGSTSSYLYESASDTVNLRIGADGPFAEFVDAGSNVLNLGNSSSALALTAASAEKMRITTDGDVGIATTSPAAKLHVVGQDQTTTSLDSGELSAIVSVTEGAPNSGASLGFGASNTVKEPFAAIKSLFQNGDDNGIGDLSVNLRPTGATTTLNEVVRIKYNGNVGIGTTNPTSLLSVHSASTDATFFAGEFQSTANASGLSNTYVKFEKGDGFGGAVGGFIEQGVGSGLKLAAINGGTLTDVITIRNNGNVGIGTTDPSTKLHVTGSTRIGANDASDAVLEIGAGASGNRTAFIDLTGDTTYSDYGFRIQRDNGGANTTSKLLHRGTGEFRLVAQEAAPIVFWTSNGEQARIDSSGRLLVGTSSALSSAGYTSNLQVQASSAGSAAISVINTSNDAFGSGLINYKSRGSSAVQAADSLGQFRFTGYDGTAYIEAARMSVEVDGTPGTNDMPGRLIFSTTADGASSPTERMRIDSSGNIFTGGTNSISAIESGTQAGKVFKSDHSASSGTTTTSQSFHFSFANTNGFVGSISTAGSGTAFNTSSDYRLKENVVDIADGITRIKQLAPKRFNFIADADTTVDGFLAHEAQTVVPEAVTGTYNEVDNDGNPVYQGIDQSKLVPLLTAALQEALAKIETLEAKVAALESK